MKKLLFLLSIVLVTAASASAKQSYRAETAPGGPGDGVANNGDKGTNNGEKGANNGEKGGPTTATASTAGTAAKAVKSNRIEEFIWAVPHEVTKVDEVDMDKAVVALYKWYLANETRINSTQGNTQSQGKSMVAPFKIDPKALQQYFQFIKKNFPGLSEESLSEKGSSVQKKLVPVTGVDDLEAPMPITTPK